MNHRRFLVRAVGVGASVASLHAFGQLIRSSPVRVGVLLVLLSPDGIEARAFRQGMAQAGYAEGRGLSIEWRSADGDYSRLAELAADLVSRGVDVIVVDTTLGARALMRATSTIPIVMTIVADPVESGLINSLAHPGGNATGLSIRLAELSAKRLQLLKEAIPGVTRAAVLSNPPTPYHERARLDLEAAAHKLSLELSFVEILEASQIPPAFVTMERARAQALVVLDCPLFFANRLSIVTQATKIGIPVISGEKPYAEAGGLMTYGANYAEQMRRSASYVDKILRGAKPSDLAVEQPTKFDLVVNARTAKALGLKLPQALLVQAASLIE